MLDHSQVRTFVGIDAHSKDCNVACMSRQGELLREVRVSTSGKELREAVKGLARPVWAVVESGSMAPFVSYALQKSIDRVIVNETRENRWISRNQSKSDWEDARRQARQLRMNEYKEVHLPKRSRQDLRWINLQLRKLTGDLTRQKNRIKAKYREQGIPLSGGAVYLPDEREKWLGRIRRSEVRFVLEVWYRSLDVAQENYDLVLKRLCKMLRGTREFKLLKTIPGVGPVTAAAMVTVIDTPWRFEHKRKLWKYAGLGIATPWSGSPEKGYARPEKSGNRVIKNAAMTAAQSALNGTNRFSEHYQRMIAGGTTRAMALKTIARQILATALAIWKSGIPYTEEH